MSDTEVLGNLELGYQGQDLQCKLATNYQGIGLPVYIYDQIIENLHRVSADVANSLSCDSISCTINMSCDAI